MRDGFWFFQLVVRYQKMRVLVEEIVTPAGSTIGHGIGVNAADGRPVYFCGDHRPMADLQAALSQQTGAPVFALVEDWQVIEAAWTGSTRANNRGIV